MIPRLGLIANWRQFTLLALANGFLGALVGLERSVLPLLADAEFGVATTRAILAFVASFGLGKALANLVAGSWSDRFGRRRVLMAGWLVGLPVPFLVFWAPDWNWVVAANALLGINQGLAWSALVIMKIDLAGPAQRGLATGLNEFAGYVAAALAALAAGLLAASLGLRLAPFVLGLAFALAGLALTLLLIRETAEHAAVEDRAAGPGADMPWVEVARQVSWRDPALSSVSQAGLVNNLNDGVAWGLFPLLFAGAGLGLDAIGVLAFAYPATWGVAQLLTGPLSDRWGRRWLIAGGMVAQGVALGLMATTSGFLPWLATSVLLGVGTAMVYPTLLAAIGDVARPAWRGTAVGVYRLWRDLGYVAGAIGAGIIADAFGLSAAIGWVGALTAASGILVAVRMPETLRLHTHTHHRSAHA